MADKTSSRAIRDFLAEAEEIIEKLNLDLVVLGEAGASGEVDPELLNGIFRGAHSLKGLSGMFGFDDISRLAHHMENLLDSLRLGKVPLGPVLVEVLFDALEILMRLVHGKGENEEFTLELEPMLARIDAVLGGSPTDKSDILARLQLDPSVLGVLTEYEEHRLIENCRKGRRLLRIRASFSLSSFDQDLAEVTELLKKQGEVISTLPCAGEVADRIGFQLLYGTGATDAEVMTRLGRDDLAVEALGESFTTSAAAPAVVGGSEPTAPPPPLEGSESQDAGSASLRSISRTVRVDIDKLDTLMNVVGELVLAKAQVASVVEKLRSNGDPELAMELQKGIRTLERRLGDLQKGVMEVRMVPIGQLFEKMVRIVRRVSGDHGKKVVTDIRGAETELDKLIMEDLSDPLMHIIRNAIDHGIESPAERESAGKPPTARISLEASQKGNHVVIEVRDDGRGIDIERVRRKAVRQGLIAEGVALSREDAYDLLFMPGFSTRDEVSDLSGRGVGMDVVRSNISALSGMIELDSQLGVGTKVSITLPITLAIIKALIVRVGDKTYAIPINSVLETLMVEPGSIRSIERREVIELRQSTLPLLRLDDLFHLASRSRRDARIFVAVVGLADKKIGIVVDELLGQQDVVIKSLGNVLTFVRGVAGAADLGNQKTILVLDVGGLMNEALRGEASAYV